MSESIAKQVAQRLVVPFDMFFVAMVVFLTAFGISQTGLFALVLFLPLLFPLVGATTSPWKNISRSDALFLILLIQYPVFHFFVANSYPLIDDPIPVRLLEYPMTWAFWVVLIFALFGRMRGIGNLRQIWRNVGPYLLIAVFLFFTFDYFTDYFGSECRTRGWVFNPIIPPVFYTMLVIASFVGWASLTRNERWLRIALLALAVIFASAYSGSRMILLVQISCFALLSFVLPVASWAERFRLVGAMAVVGISALGLGAFIDYFMQCGFGEKMLKLFKAVLGLDPTQGASINARALLIERAIGAVMERPWTGYGIGYEKIISDPYYHIHNQYLSWMIWAGVTSFVSGCFFVLAPAISLVRTKGRDGIVVAIATSLVLLLNSFSDSLLYHEAVMFQFLVTVLFIQTLGQSQPKVKT